MLPLQSPRAPLEPKVQAAMQQRPVVVEPGLPVPDTNERHTELFGPVRSDPMVARQERKKDAFLTSAGGRGAGADVPRPLGSI